MEAPHVALVTGANRGIGLGICRRLGHLGTHVVMACRNEVEGARVCRLLREEGISAESTQIDIGDITSVRVAFESLVAGGLTQLDVLVNNAGVFEASTAEDMTWPGLEAMLRVNIGGAANMIHVFLPLLINSQRPRIVNVSSITASMSLLSNGQLPAGNWKRRPGYTVSKAGLNMLTAQYAAAFERRAEHAHVRINSVAPPYTATRMNDYAGEATIERSSEVVVQLALRSDDGPNGGFIGEYGEVPW
jgi:NAD(P)-dependent dehydrogenase (short-subunit alcohol dehydrogenase family)